MTKHWPEYLAEAGALALFMMSASTFATLLWHDQSPVQGFIADPHLRRVLMGAAMGLTAATIIYSPIGARSGAHMNPSVTLAFTRLGKITPRDAGFYLAAQFTGAIVGMLTAYALIGRRLGEPAVHFVQTRPGSLGPIVAAGAELTISFLMMSMVLRLAAHPRTMRFTGAAAGTLVMLYITLEDPLSGMSMNPARTLGPALLAGNFDSLWVYFVAPPLGMLLAAEVFRRNRPNAAHCAKLYHSSAVRCIFCGFEPGRDVHLSDRRHEETETLCTTT